MAGNLYVRQFARLAEDASGHTVEAGQEPGKDTPVAFTGTSASLTLHKETCFVELHADAVCHYVLGPAATTSNMRLPADGTVFKGIHQIPSQDTVLSVIEGT